LTGVGDPTQSDEVVYMHADFTAEAPSQDVVLLPPAASIGARVTGTLSPAAQADVRRILDSAARRLLAEQLDPSGRR
jgi:hypothetical protein